MEVEVELEDKKGMKKEYGKYDKYEVENWADTLMKAEEIKQDAEKMKYVKQCLAKKKTAINSIADLRAVAQEKAEKEMSS